MLTASIFAILPSVNAHTPPWNIPTYAYVSFSPNTVGVGQYTQIVMWLDKYPPTAAGLGGDRWRGFTLDITKPDGNKITIPYTGMTSQVGSAWIVYTPDQAGNYTVVFSWPGQTLALGTEPAANGIPYVGDFYQPSTSAPATLQVQQQQIISWQEPPLPTAYWSRPINDANRGWSTLASNWLGGAWLVGNWQTEGQAPNTPHIMWAQPLTFGGIADAQWPGVTFWNNDYDWDWTGFSPIIINGQIFYNTPTYPKYGFYSVDLRTGKQNWYQNNTNLNQIFTIGGGGGDDIYALRRYYPLLSFGQLYHYHSVNGQGVDPYLWSTQTLSNGTTLWHMLDAYTGNWILTLKNVPGGTAVTDQDGSLLRYSYNSLTGQFLCWNSSQSIPPLGPTSSNEQQWKPPVGYVIDAVNDNSWTAIGPIAPTGSSPGATATDILPRSGYTMNVTGPLGLPPIARVLQDDNRVPKIMLLNDMTNLATYTGGSNSMIFLAAAVQINEHAVPYSPFPDKTPAQNTNLGFGLTLLWNKTITKPLGGNLTFSLGPVSYDDKVFTVSSKETMQWWGYSLTDGSLLWGPTNPQGSWDMYGMGGVYAYGHLYSSGYGGILYCYDIKTGKLLWTYTAKSVGYESPYGNYQLSTAAVADGKIYMISGEHSPTKPLWRGSYLRCINATDGTEIWKIQDFNMGLGVADGYIVTGNSYDDRMYSIGKGPSATTVTASPAIIATGSAVLIQGTVTDQSPGAKDTPAIADASMEQWMEYLYMQQAMPTNATGVPVTLTAIDPNGNTQNIGTVTSDILGNYAVTWKPPVPGLYTVLANFAGTNSYYGSLEETHFAVGAAAVAAVPASPQATATPSTATPGQTVTPSPQVTTTPIPPPSSPGVPTTYIVIAAVAIIAVVAAAALALRRRK